LLNQSEMNQGGGGEEEEEYAGGRYEHAIYIPSQTSNFPGGGLEMQDPRGGPPHNMSAQGPHKAKFGPEPPEPPQPLQPPQPRAFNLCIFMHF
jgi:hypothetical protein